MVAKITFGNITDETLCRSYEGPGVIKRAGLSEITVCTCHVHNKKAVNKHKIAQALLGCFKACQDHRADFLSMDANSAAYRLFRRQGSVNHRYNTLLLTIEYMLVAINSDVPWHQRMNISLFDNNINEDATGDDKDSSDCCVVMIFSRGQTEGGKFHRFVSSQIMGDDVNERLAHAYFSPAFQYAKTARPRGIPGLSSKIGLQRWRQFMPKMRPSTRHR